MRDAVAFAHQWIDAWNSHDIDRIAAHYDSDVVFTSPVVTRLGFGADGTIHGSTVLQAYFTRALTLVSDLLFRPRHLLVGAAGVTSFGLSIVRTIAAADDGRVRAHPRDGGGLTVTLELPVAPLSGETAGAVGTRLRCDVWRTRNAFGRRSGNHERTMARVAVREAPTSLALASRAFVAAGTLVSRA